MLTQLITDCSRQQIKNFLRLICLPPFSHKQFMPLVIFFPISVHSHASLSPPFHISSRPYTICASSPSLYAHCCILFLLSLWSIFSCFPVYTPLQSGVLLNVTSQEEKQCGQSTNPFRGVSGMGSWAGLGRIKNFLRLIRCRDLNINP